MHQEIEQIAGGNKANFAMLMEEKIVQIAGGNEVKMTRMRKICSWFDNKQQMSWMAQAMIDHMKKSERLALWNVHAVPVAFIEVLLWATEKTDSPKEWTR